MLQRRHRHRDKGDPGELNITAFLNLMVILVPFLLITAVFSRLAILEVTLPSPDTSEPPAEQDEPPLPPPTVLVRESGLALRKPDGQEVEWPRSDAGEYDFNALNVALRNVKANASDEDKSKEAAVVLLQPAINYDILIQVMDAVRSTKVDDAQGTRTEVALYPEISLGEIASTESQP
nr:biopolymer transporter ExbD [Oceanococcus sp. HetDA_MAG_MS8]